MSSPIAHAGLLSLVWPPARRMATGRRSPARRAAFFIAITFALVAPDIDVAFGPLLGKPPAAYHNGFTHSLAFTILFAAAFGAALHVFGIARFLPAALLGLACGLSHIAIDAFTFGRGIPLFWPFSDARIAGPTLFFGVRHSVNAPLRMHLWTILCDGTFALAVYAWSRALYRPGRRAAAEPS